jgi:NAD(P)-dependent dehydrogenase (short-subunit alcohol dehydrogenase family)
MLLRDRVALIVGGGGGLGRAVAAAFGREGSVVGVADVNREAAQETLQRAEPRAGMALDMDIADPADCRRGVETVAGRFGRLDILVNCAALCLVDPLLEVTPERWDQVFAVNARGAFFCLQAAARVMIPQQYGCIITISTPASRMGFPLFASYGASKAAVDSLTRAAAVALAPHGITVNTIVPGRMTAGMVDRLEQDLVKVTGKTAEELAAERTKGLPMQRRVAPEEVAEAAVWLASEAAAYVTAERLNFTGGMELS